MITYMDFLTGKKRSTRGKFTGWRSGKGFLCVRFAIIERQRSVLLIPEYLLTPSSRKSLKDQETH